MTKTPPISPHSPPCSQPSSHLWEARPPWGGGASPGPTWDEEPQVLPSSVGSGPTCQNLDPHPAPTPAPPSLQAGLPPGVWPALGPAAPPTQPWDGHSKTREKPDIIRAAGHASTCAVPLPQPRNQPRPAPRPFRGDKPSGPHSAWGHAPRHCVTLASANSEGLRSPQQSGKGDPALMSALHPLNRPLCFPRRQSEAAHISAAIRPDRGRLRGGTPPQGSWPASTRPSLPPVAGLLPSPLSSLPSGENHSFPLLRKHSSSPLPAPAVHLRSPLPRFP